MRRLFSVLTIFTVAVFGLTVFSASFSSPIVSTTPAHAQSNGLSTLPQVTPPYDVNATIPGEGYQGWAGPYGGQKILHYCYFNRFLGEPKAGKTMLF